MCVQYSDCRICSPQKIIRRRKFDGLLAESSAGEAGWRNLDFSLGDSGRVVGGDALALEAHLLDSRREVEDGRADCVPVGSERLVREGVLDTTEREGNNVKGFLQATLSEDASLPWQRWTRG